MDRCKNIVSHSRLGLIKAQCKRKVFRDGYCWQHHPKAIKDREDHREKKLEATPFVMFINK